MEPVRLLHADVIEIAAAVMRCFAVGSRRCRSHFFTILLSDTIDVGSAE